MARRSQTELAVLGALSIQPMTGYAVRHGIQETLGHFWSESFGQIYPTLARLEEERLIERVGKGGTSGSIFRLTRSGRKRLRTLLREPIPRNPPRNGLLLRLFFGRHLGTAEVRAMLLEAREETIVASAEYQQIRSDAESEAVTADSPFWSMTLSWGEHAASAHIAWIDECLEALTTMDPQNAQGPTKSDPHVTEL